MYTNYEHSINYMIQNKCIDNFKNDVFYTGILEYVPRVIGLEYIKYIEKILISFPQISFEHIIIYI